jgi:hypothetical protein
MHQLSLYSSLKCTIVSPWAVVLALASVVVEGAGVLTDGAGGNRGSRAAILGWTLDTRSFAVVAYLALGPGLVGHTGYNGVLRYVSCLVAGLYTLHAGGPIA